MERAARLFKNKKVSQELFSDDQMVRAVWPQAVGKSIAAHTSRVRLVRSTLVVEVQDAIWQKQLFFLSGQIVARVRQLTGSDIVQDVEFRIGVPRREAQRAEAPREYEIFGDSSSGGDEAEGIQDAVLKKVYRMSRRKATG